MVSFYVHIPSLPLYQIVNTLLKLTSLLESIEIQEYTCISLSQYF